MLFFEHFGILEELVLNAAEHPIAIVRADPPRQGIVTAREAIVFVGGIPTLLRHRLRLLEAEYPEFEIRHVDGVRDLADITASGTTVVLAILDESLIVGLIGDPSGHRAAADGGRLVVAYREDEMALSLLDAMRDDDALKGAGLLPLNASAEAWVSCTHLLLCGEVFLSRALLDAVAAPPQSAAVPPEAAGERAHGAAKDGPFPDGLTPREWEVLEMLAQGRQNKQIAVGLEVTEHTVKLHVHHLLKKLGVTNRTGAARWYSEHRSHA